MVETRAHVQSREPAGLCSHVRAIHGCYEMSVLLHGNVGACPWNGRDSLILDDGSKFSMLVDGTGWVHGCLSMERTEKETCPSLWVASDIRTFPRNLSFLPSSLDACKDLLLDYQLQGRFLTAGTLSKCRDAL